MGPFDTGHVPGARVACSSWGFGALDVRVSFWALSLVILDFPHFQFGGGGGLLVGNSPPNQKEREGMREKGEREETGTKQWGGCISFMLRGVLIFILGSRIAKPLTPYSMLNPKFVQDCSSDCFGKFSAL